MRYGRGVANEKLHKLAGKLATQQDIALTLESPGQKFLSAEENELIQDLDDAMWDPKLQIPEEFRNLEPIWRKLNKASLDQTAMRRENRALMAENSQLQAAMKNYLDRWVDDVDPAKNVFQFQS